MKIPHVAKSVAVVVSLLMVTPTSIAQTCPTPGCDLIGPGTACAQFVRNPEFVHGCGWTRASTIGYVDLTAYARNLAAEDFTIPADQPGNLDLSYEIEILPSSAGTERVHVEIVEGFTILDTVDIKTASDASGSFSLPLSSTYKGKTVYVRFRRFPGSAPGNTTFRIQKVYLFAL